MMAVARKHPLLFVAATPGVTLFQRRHPPWREDDGRGSQAPTIVRRPPHGIPAADAKSLTGGRMMAATQRSRRSCTDTRRREDDGRGSQAPTLFQQPPLESPPLM